MNTTSSASPNLVDGLQDWIGKKLIIDDEVTLPAVRRIAAMDDLDPVSFKRGDPIAPHWYSMFFTLNVSLTRLLSVIKE